MIPEMERAGQALPQKAPEIDEPIIVINRCPGFGEPLPKGHREFLIMKWKDDTKWDLVPLAMFESLEEAMNYHGAKFLDSSLFCPDCRIIFRSQLEEMENQY